MASRASKRRRLSPSGSDNESSTVQKVFYRSAANWNLEQDYEKTRRKGSKRAPDSNRLPIKTADGVLHEAQTIEEDGASAASGAQWDDDDDETPSTRVNGHAQEEPRIPEKEQILKAKEELAKIALKLSENPEENASAFKALTQVGQSKIVMIQKLCLLTRLAVYKDVIPGYRIRSHAEDSGAEQVSKEVRKLRAYEQALVSGYQAYLKELARLAKGGPPLSGSGLADVAITCTCTLLTSVPHFNFRGDLLSILVRKLSTRKLDESFAKARKALETLFREDEEGRPSMEAVSLLTKMIKVREYRVDDSVLNLFLHLRLLSEYSGKGSQDQSEQPSGVGMKGRKKQEIRSKREKKLLKTQKALDKDMAEADALVSHEERDRMQSETLKLVFATYFRVLKQRSPHLMGAVLEGLAKYAHLINQNFFGDLLEALKDLIRQSGRDDEGDISLGEMEDDESLMGIRNASREALLCTVTAFALLAGQDAHNARADLHLDLSFFTTHLFRGLLALSLNPDLELGANSLRLPDPDNPLAAAPNKGGNKVNLQTTTVLLIRCLTAVLLPPYNIRSVPPLRLAAFTKQLMSASLHVPEKSCQAILVLLNDVVHTHGKKISALWNTEERKGDGSYSALSDSVEGSNPFATTVWEGEILRKHFCPKVREGVVILQKSLRN